MARWSWPWSRRKVSPVDKVDGYAPGAMPVEDPWAAPEIVAQMEQRVEEVPSEGARLDGWRNELTGVGDFLRDKTMGGRQGGLEFVLNLVTNAIAEHQWRGSDLGGRVVETIPDEMTREGWDIVVQPSAEDEPQPSPIRKTLPPKPKAKVPEVEEEEEEPEAEGDEPKQQADAFGFNQKPEERLPAPLAEPDDEGEEIAEMMEGEMERVGALRAIYTALCYERGYGGAAILVCANDGQRELAKPLDEKRIKSVDGLTPLSGGWDGECVAWSYYNDPTKPNYGMPEIYMVRNTGVPVARVPAPGSTMTGPVLPPNLATVWWVHESRLIVFPGVAVSHRARVQMRGWGDGVFTRVNEVLQQYGQTWGGVANLMTDFAQAVLKIKGLAQSIAANKQVVSSRALQLNLGRSISRILMLDADEEFSRDVVSLAGLAEVLEQFALRLAAASGMPLSLLMGQVQGGLGDASAGDIRFFYDRVASWQKKGLLPQVRRLVKLLFLAQEGPTDGQEPEKWSVVMRPLYQLDALQEATRRKVIAETDAIYAVQIGGVTPEEVVGTRFSGSEFNDGPLVIDFDARNAMNEARMEAPRGPQAQHILDPEGNPMKGPDGNPMMLGPDGKPLALPPLAPPEGAPVVPGAPPVPGAEPEISLQLTPTVMGGIVKVNQALQKMGLPTWPDADGELTINEFMAKRGAAAGAQVANLEKGVVGAPETVEQQAARKAEEAKSRFGQKPFGKPGGGEGGPLDGDQEAPGKPPVGKSGGAGEPAEPKETPPNKPKKFPPKE